MIDYGYGYDNEPDDDPWTILRSEKRVARKRHSCDTCSGGWIESGEQYQLIVYLDEYNKFKIDRHCTYKKFSSDPTCLSRCLREQQALDAYDTCMTSFLDEDGQ